MDNIFFDLKRLKYLGVGAMIGKTVRIRRPEDTIIGDYAIIDDFTYIACALEIGRSTHIASNCNLSGGAGKVTMGDYSGAAAGSSIYAATSEYIGASLDQGSVPPELRFGGIVEDVRFDHYAFCGARCVVLPGVHLPVGCLTAAGTVVRKKVYEPWTLYGGEDCRKLCRRRHQRLDAHVKKFKLTSTDPGVAPPSPPK